MLRRWTKCAVERSLITPRVLPALKNVSATVANLTAIRASASQTFQSDHFAEEQLYPLSLCARPYFGNQIERNRLWFYKALTRTAMFVIVNFLSGCPFFILFICIGPVLKYQIKLQD